MATARSTRRPRRARGPAIRRTPVAPTQRPLYCRPDHGAPVVLDPAVFAPAQRDRGWGPYCEPFLRLNQSALDALDVRAELAAQTHGTVLRLHPGGSAGAIPLRSAQTGRIAAGLVVRPRFGWAGIGRVLSDTGWHAAPKFLDLPLVPGSGREVPPWVLAGPVIHRLLELLRAVRRGYQVREETLRRPRGTIRWHRYATESLARGRWHHLPCRFPDLESDPRLRRMVRWTLERLHLDLVRVGGTDPFAAQLALLAAGLLEELRDVCALVPRRQELGLMLGAGAAPVLDEALRRGVEAIAWVVEERGLGGGREQDGLAWQLPLDRLWEAYVESVVRREAAVTGGEIKVGRLGQTTFPLQWSDPTHRSLGHLVPDIVVHRGRSVHVIDAKYKAHLAELDEGGWHRFAAEAREAHRGDLHQVLAYASLYEAEEVTASLWYPLRAGTWEALHERGRDVSRAELLHGGRRVRLELRGLPFGGRHSPGEV